MMLGVAELFILALIIAGVVGIGLVMRRLVESGEKPKRRLITNDQEEIVIIGEARHSEPVSFSRKGTYASDAMRLEAGVYKIEYQFPETSLVKVDLISAADGETETIALKTGSGSLAFTVRAPGRFIVQVEPVDEAADWSFEFRRI
jgi:hypothetical protein